MTKYLIFSFITIILITAVVSFVYFVIYKTRINKRLIINEGKKLPMPITITSIAAVTAVIISFLLFFLLISIDAFSSPVPLPKPIVGYDYYSYEDIKPNMKTSIYKPFLDNEEIIPGYELGETDEINDFKYYLYINKETTKKEDFIIFIKYLGEEIPNLDSMFGIYTKAAGSTQYSGFSSAGIYRKAYLITGYVEEDINLKIVFEHRIIAIKDNEKDLDNYESYAKFEKEFLLTP